MDFYHSGLKQISWIGGMTKFIEQSSARDVRAEMHWFQGHTQFSPTLTKILHASQGTKNLRRQFLPLPPHDQRGHKASHDSRQLRLKLTKVLEQKSTNTRVNFLGQGVRSHFCS